MPVIKSCSPIAVFICFIFLNTAGSTACSSKDTGAGDEVLLDWRLDLPLGAMLSARIVCWDRLLGSPAGIVLLFKYFRGCTLLYFKLPALLSIEASSIPNSSLIWCAFPMPMLCGL